MIVEHDPLLYEDAEKRMVENLSPGPEADLQGGHHPALCAGARPSPAEANRAGRSGILHLQRAGEGPGRQEKDKD